MQAIVHNRTARLSLVALPLLRQALDVLWRRCFKRISPLALDPPKVDQMGFLDVVDEQLFRPGVLPRGIGFIHRSRSVRTIPSAR